MSHTIRSRIGRRIVEDNRQDTAELLRESQRTVDRQNAQIAHLRARLVASVNSTRHFRERCAALKAENDALLARGSLAARCDSPPGSRPQRADAPEAPSGGTVTLTFDDDRPAPTRVLPSRHPGEGRDPCKPATDEVLP